MKSRYPALDCEASRSALRFSGIVRPWNGGADYEVEAVVKDWGDPDVRVLSPTLQPGAPHTYDDEGLLCLYHPDRRPWKLTDLAAMTVLPWTELWLYFYESWLQTGVWWGPEAPH